MANVPPDGPAHGARGFPKGPTMTIQTLAADYSARFIQITRDDGSTPWIVAPGKQTAELTALCHQAHGDLLPDDWRYSFIVEALDAISAHEDEESARDSIDAAIYPHELTDWLNSGASRLEYCDEAAWEFGCTDQQGRFIGTTQLLQLGQWHEKREVFESVFRSLQTICDETEEAA